MSSLVRPFQNALAGPSKITRVAASARALHTSAPAPLAKAGPLSPRPAEVPGLSGKSGALRMIMFGKPGAGKGTLSGRLVKKYELLSLSTGDLLRQHIAEKTEVGRLAEKIVASGGLIPDDVMLKVLTSKLDALRDKHWILDGFPRTLGQGKLLDAHLRAQNMPLSLVINLDVPDSIILNRISDRWVHLPSGRVYNMSYNRPKVDGFDDETGEPLTKRPDDNPEIFARRLEQFYESTSPLLDFYAAQQANARSATQLVTLTGNTSDEIWPLLEATVTRVAAGLRVREDARRRASIQEAMLGDGKAMKAPYGQGPLYAVKSSL